MREIKFRALRQDLGGWWYGCLSQCELSITSHLYGRARINIETVGQYTGLKDKNGKEIYEGDIWATKNNGNDGQDIWLEDDFKLKVVSWDDIYHRWDGLPCVNSYNSVYRQKYSYIIGNIHENPELLKQNQA